MNKIVTYVLATAILAFQAYAVGAPAESAAAVPVEEATEVETVSASAPADVPEAAPADSAGAGASVAAAPEDVPNVEAAAVPAAVLEESIPLAAEDVSPAEEQEPVFVGAAPVKKCFAASRVKPCEKDAGLGVRFGGRLALGGFKFDNAFMSVAYGVSMGTGLSIAGTAAVPVSNRVYFTPELVLSYRNIYRERIGMFDDDYELVVGDFTYSINEFAVGIPLLFRGEMPAGGSKLFFEAGIRFDMPFEVTQISKLRTGKKKYDEYEYEYKERSDVDIGIVYGIGMHITKCLSLGVRNVVYLTDFSRLYSSRFSHFDIGLTAVFGGSGRRGE